MFGEAQRQFPDTEGLSTLSDKMSPPAPIDVDLVGVTDTSSVPVPDPLTVNGISSWREKMTKMPTGVAAACSSDMFKSPVRSSPNLQEITMPEACA